MKIPIIGLGASAGGFQAFRDFLAALPENPGMAFVFAQHLDPSRQDPTAELLSKHTPLPVHLIEDGMEIGLDRVYVLPAEKNLALARGKFILSECTEESSRRTVIDRFFRSLAENLQDKAIAVVLSGSGSDGAFGTKAVKAAGGLVIAEDPEEARHTGMPRSAIATGWVDYVLPVEKIPEALMDYVHHSFIAQSETAIEVAERESANLNKILSLLQIRNHLDFRGYKKSTLARRIQRRMGLRHLESLGEYLNHLRRNSAELNLLFKDLLIGVTHFFRDPETFHVLERDVIPRILAEKTVKNPIRIWIPGCSTGEEAYSLAMLFSEAIQSSDQRTELKIFATDIDEGAVEVARNGIYPEGISAEVPRKYLKRYFTRDGQAYRVNNLLRETLVFATQNMISDPPFSRMDLISCRNVLIYLEPEVQKKLIDFFKFSLNDGGFLLLGNSESVGRDSPSFEVISKRHRIYRRVGASRGNSTAPFSSAEVFPKTVFSSPSVKEKEMVSFMAESILLEEFAPASVIVNRNHEILFFHGPTANYLNLPSGKPTHDLMALAKEGLKTKLRSAIHRGMREGRWIEVADARLKRDGKYHPVRIRVKPVDLPDEPEKAFLITFEDVSSSRSDSTEATESSPSEDSLIEQLEKELTATRERLQSAIEELETSNEELKASNEEVMSMNEELQSTNEELETSKEELQSLNEELITVNNQLEEKVDELERSGNDLYNLLASTDIATLFVDPKCRIKQHTPAVKKLFHLLDGDMGRPVKDLSGNFEDPDFMPDIEGVLKDLNPREKEIRTVDGKWYLRRVTPYRTLENKVDGAVLTFTDVTSLKQLQLDLSTRVRQNKAVADLGMTALASDSVETVMEQAVEALSRHLGVEFVKILELLPGKEEFLLVSGLGWKEGTIGKARLNAHGESQAGYVLRSKTPIIVEDIAHEKRFTPSKLLLDHGVVGGMSVLIPGMREPYGVVGVHSKSRVNFSQDDIHFLQAVANILGGAIQWFQYEKELEDSQAWISLISDSVPVMISYVDRDRVFRFNNRAYETTFGVDRSEVTGKPVAEVLGERAYQVAGPYIDRTLAGERVTFEAEVPYELGGTRYVRVDYVPDRGGNGTVNGFFALINDITERKKAEDELRDLNETLEERVRERTTMLELLHDIAALTNEAESIEEAFHFTIQRVCDYNNWCFGHFFTVSNSEPKHLELTALFHDNSASAFSTFQNLTRDIFLQRGEGLPGQAWVRKEVLWTTDVGEGLLGPRMGAAEPLDVKVAVCVPVLVEGEVMAVIEFFSDSSDSLDEERIQVLSTVASHLNRVIERRMSGEKIEASERQFRAIFNNAGVGIAVLHPNDRTRLLETNWTLERMLGRSKDELVGSPFSSITDPSDDWSEEIEDLRGILGRNHQATRRRKRLKSADGSRIWVNSFYSLLEADNPAHSKVIAIFEDVTEQVEAEKALVESEEVIRTFIDGVRDYAIVFLDREGKVVTWNPGAEKIKGYSTEEIVGQHFSRFYTEEDRAEGKPQLALRIAAEKGSWEDEGWRVTKGGRRFMAHVLLTALFDENGRLRGYAKITRDVSERRELEEMIANISLEQQRRIAAELHDGIGQQLTGIRYISQSLANRLRKTGHESAELAEHLSEQTAHALKEMRDLSRGVHPVEVDGEGLILALQQLLAETEKIFSVKCSLNSDGNIQVSDNNTATQLYYITREAITNEMKHGSPRHLQINLAEKDHRLDIWIRSDGRGFDVEATEKKGMGLRTMKYRANLIGAQFNIESAPGEGTTIRCSINNQPPQD